MNGRIATAAADITGCTRCPRLVAWREQLARHPPARHAGEDYWARPVPGFGDPAATILVLLMATSGHGGNRTGRVLTGSRTADWTVAALHEAGLATRPTSHRRGDGLELRSTWAASAVRCPAPRDKPSPTERATCARHLAAELSALPGLRVVVALGADAWTAATRHYDARPRPRFAHGAEVVLDSRTTLLGCYHPSPRNTNTGVLTKAMLDTVFTRAATLASLADHGTAGRQPPPQRPGLRVEPH